MALSLGLSESQKLLVARAQRSRQVKLESTVAREPGRWSPVESCDPYGAPELPAESLDDKVLLRSRLECLDCRERIILSLRYGLDDEIPLTLREIGNRLGVTREWVRRIELKAVQKLRGEQPIDETGRTHRSRTSNGRRRTGKIVARRARSSSQRGITAPDAVSGQLSQPLPRPPALPVRMPLFVWDNRFSVMSTSTGSDELDSRRIRETTCGYLATDITPT